jgi:hypothetical protein
MNRQQEETNKILSVYNATSLAQGPRQIAKIMSTEQHMNDFFRLLELSGCPVELLHEKGPTSGKTALNFAIEGLCNYILNAQYSESTIKNVIHYKINAISSMLCNFPNLEQLKLKDTVDAMSALQAACLSIIAKKPKITNHESFIAAGPKLQGCDLYILITQMYLQDLIEMATLNEKLINESKQKSGDTAIETNPIFLFESHSDPAMLLFMKASHRDLFTAGYTLLVELSNKTTVDEHIKGLKDLPEKLRTERGVLRLELLQLYKASGLKIVSIDPRAGFHADINPETAYYDIARCHVMDQYFSITLPSCDQIMALQIQKEMLLNNGKVIVHAGCKHASRIINFLKSVSPSINKYSFILRSVSTAGAIRCEAEIIANGDAQLLELSSEPQEIGQQLQDFKDKLLLGGNSRKNKLAFRV